jgi:hypothetical protein
LSELAAALVERLLEAFNYVMPVVVVLEDVPLGVRKPESYDGSSCRLYSRLRNATLSSLPDQAMRSATIKSVMLRRVSSVICEDVGHNSIVVCPPEALRTGVRAASLAR